MSLLSCFEEYGAICHCCFVAQSKDATLRNVNHMWHVLVAEDGNEKICAELIEWMNQRHS